MAEQNDDFYCERKLQPIYSCPLPSKKSGRDFLEEFDIFNDMPSLNCQTGNHTSKIEKEYSHLQSKCAFLSAIPSLANWTVT